MFDDVNQKTNGWSALSGRRDESYMPIGYKGVAMQMNFECKVKPFTDDARGWGEGGITSAPRIKRTQST